jgi:hypothetical protein
LNRLALGLAVFALIVRFGAIAFGFISTIDKAYPTVKTLFEIARTSAIAGYFYVLHALHLAH